MSDTPTPPQETPSSNTAESEQNPPSASDPASAPIADPEVVTSEPNSSSEPPAAKDAPAAPAVDSTESTTPTAEPAAAYQPKTQPEPKSGGYYWGTGRRKRAIARVRIRPGNGKFLINKREIDDYFCTLRDRTDVILPLKQTKTFGKFDVFVNLHGGGSTGQSGAVVLGVARALLKADPDLLNLLRNGNLLTRDPRQVERKKPGQPGARKRFQFSKR